MTETVYLAIYKTQTLTVSIEYVPRADGTIEIVSVDVQQQPLTPWYERELERRKHPKNSNVYSDFRKY